MDAEFEVAACHGDHAGKAHVIVRRGGAEIAVQHMPFDTQEDEQLPEEQARILADAARIARQTADFLEVEAKLVRGWPTHAAAPGPAPGPASKDDDAPNVFAQPPRRSQS